MAHRLKSKTGCLNCKARRKKRDETRPICQACYRLALPCNFEDNSEASTSNKPLRRDASSAVMKTASSSFTARKNSQRAVPVPEPYRLLPIENITSICPESVDIGDFHQIDVADKERPLALARVHRMVDLNIKHMWPFIPEGGLLTNVRASWLVPILRHGIFINGVIAISAGTESNGGTVPYWQNMRRKYEAILLAN